MARNSDGTVTIKRTGKTGNASGSGKPARGFTPSPKLVGVKGKTVEPGKRR
ncbi:hypothetical protein AB0F25_30490 [Streptomyces wedmorensis]|uniref:hypothetical protein n=1 Tax=Streptomyces wedmorensis TaxID=43759 RepID=UPI0034283F9C